MSFEGAGRREEGGEKNGPSNSIAGHFLFTVFALPTRLAFAAADFAAALWLTSSWHL